MKYEWRKEEKEFYGAKTFPTFVEVPSLKFITIKGKGNPNEEDFSERIGVLYSLAYGIKMLYKKEPDVYEDYVVFPLEGKWTSTSLDPKDKDAFVYTIMIQQPSWITEDLFKRAYENVTKKKPHPLLKEVQFEEMTDGLCVQMLHKGSYDTEPDTFAQMDAYVRENGYERVGEYHREIYLSDARRTIDSKKKTILRYSIQKK